jgi:hypothetical protein
MKGDYSRDTWDSGKNYARVLMQQGRVQLDADWNEQGAILLHYIQTLARDLIGPYGVPWESQGFAMTVEPDADNSAKIADLKIGMGNYYVDGILCEMNRQYTFYQQPNYPLDKIRTSDQLPPPPFLVFLDVWERHITGYEDPSIQEVALGGPDTAARSEIVWQVKVRRWDDLKLPLELSNARCDQPTQIQEIMAHLMVNLPKPFSSDVTLAAQAQIPEDLDQANVCIVSPEARYRGTENQLYRVEIHRGGKAGTESGATFKWSRENGSVFFPIRAVADRTISLDHLGRDERFGLEVGDWVEVLDDSSVLRGESWPLLQVTAIEPIELLVTLSGAPAENVGRDQTRHPLLRRWDHQKGDKTTGGLQIANDGAALVVESDDHWLNLEDGIQILFPTSNTTYFSGNYWLIPARTLTGDIEWPKRNGKPEALEPRGIRHHYAPLAIVPAASPATGGFRVTDLRHFMVPTAICCPVIHVAGPATAVKGDAVVFTAELSHLRVSDPALTLTWSAVGGTIASPHEPTSIKVQPADDAKEVLAHLTIEHLPENCPNHATGRCIIVEGT